MEEEIPAALEIIGKGMKQDSSQGKVFSMKKILFSSMLRLTVGYCFLVTLFMTVVQESEVLGIFFDVLGKIPTSTNQLHTNTLISLHTFFQLWSS